MNAHEAKTAVLAQVLYTYEEARNEVKKRWPDREILCVPQDTDYFFQYKTTILGIARMKVDSNQPADKRYALSFYDPFIQTVRHDIEHDRKYLPTLPDLVDRLTIVQQKMIFIPERATEYEIERADIIHDIDILLKNGPAVSGKAVAAIALIMLTNRVIWENESLARKGGSDQDKMLKFTHSINGVRNTAKNVLAGEFGGRHDYKLDCFAAEFGEAFGNWNVFDKL